MKKLPGVLAAALLLLAASPAEGPGAARAVVEHGRYLVHEVAMCVQCHTPQRRAALDGGRLLTGASLPLSPALLRAGWAPRAPAIAGLPAMTPPQAVHLLRFALRPDGTAPLPPMPPFHLRGEDATAVVAYLRSLSGAAP